AGYRTSR
ncbi:pyridine nucleotide-disulfide oxidoreductase family protein, partial [Vibrio parahaemolyticus EKP-028]